MLKIARSQTSAHRRLAALFVDYYNDDASQASLELLITQSMQRTPVEKGYLTCPVRGVRFHLDRRMALYDFLLFKDKWCHGEGKKASVATERQFHVSVMEWGDDFLYCYQPHTDSVEVIDLEQMLSDLCWYHTSWCVPFLHTESDASCSPKKTTCG